MGTEFFIVFAAILIANELITIRIYGKILPDRENQNLKIWLKKSRRNPLSNSLICLETREFAGRVYMSIISPYYVKTKYGFFRIRRFSKNYYDIRREFQLKSKPKERIYF